MKKSIIFCMLLSYCVARSIDTGAEVGAEVLDTPKEAVLEKSDILTDEIVEENLSQIEAQKDESAGDPSTDDNKRFLFPTLGTAATTPPPQRPFTQSIDLLLVLNSMSMTARK